MWKSVEDMIDPEKWVMFFRYASDPRQRDTVNEAIALQEVLQMAGDRLMSIN